MKHRTKERKYTSIFRSTDPVETKRKSTYNLSIRIITKLERYWSGLRLVYPKDMVTKTEIVEEALDRFINTQMKEK